MFTGERFEGKSFSSTDCVVLLPSLQSGNRPSRDVFNLETDTLTAFPTMADERDAIHVDGKQTNESIAATNIGLFIDEEFSNIFDSDSDLEESLFEDNPASCSNSSRILAQQIQKLNESTGDSSRQNAQDKESNGVGEVCSIAAKEEMNLDPNNMTQQQLEKVAADGRTEDQTFKDPREIVVTDDQIIDVLEEVGNIWKIIGPILNIKQAKIKNIDHDYQHNTDKAYSLLTTWKEQEGKKATVESLENALHRIKRKDIADKFLEIVGISSHEIEPIQFIEKPLNLNIKVGLTTEYDEPDTSVLLCEDATGRKYLVKEITDDTHDWNIEKIVDNERVLERMIIAARNSRKTKEERRQESLKRVSTELIELRKRMEKVRLHHQDKTDKSKRDARPQSDNSTPNLNKITLDETQEMLRMCVIQSENAQMIFKVLIKLIGEVGHLEGNSRCLRQLSDFTKELRDQDGKLSPKLVLLDALKDNLDDDQKSILERLQKWQLTLNKQVDGIEKLITSLLEQGKLAWKRKTSNRKSEPIFNKIGGTLVGRRRVKTDSCESKQQYLNSLQDERDEQIKKQISSPLCARQLQNL